MIVWHAFRARPQRERDVRNEMFMLGADALVPVEFRPCTIGRHKTHRPRALAPGYVFAGWPAGERVPWGELRLIDGYVGPMAFGETLARLTQAQVDALQLLSSDAPSAAKPLYRYKLGDRVRVERGARAEIMALVKELNEKGCVVEWEMMRKVHRQLMPHEALHPA